MDYFPYIGKYFVKEEEDDKEIYHVKPRRNIRKIHNT